jgi:ketosteroid isomerase-like protein
MSENKALVRRYYEEIGRGNLAAMDELVAEDYIDHSPPPVSAHRAAGREGLKENFRLFLKATPGYHVIEDQIAVGDKVVTRLRACEGDFPGIPRTGNRLEMRATVIHWIRRKNSPRSGRTRTLWGCGWKV